MTIEEQRTKKQAGEDFETTTDSNIVVSQKLVNKEATKTEEVTEDKSVVSEVEFTPDVKIGDEVKEPVETEDVSIPKETAETQESTNSLPFEVQTTEPIANFDAPTETSEISTDAPQVQVENNLNSDFNDNQSSIRYDIPEDIKYFKNPEAIPKIMEIIEKNVTDGVKDLIKKEFERLVEPLVNTSEVGERSYRLADKIVRTGPNLDSFNECEAITRIRDNGKDTSDEFVGATPNYVSDTANDNIIKFPVEEISNENESFNPLFDPFSGTNSNGYGEDQDPNKKFGIGA